MARTRSKKQTARKSTGGGSSTLQSLRQSQFKKKLLKKRVMANWPKITRADGSCLCSTCGKRYGAVKNLNRHIRKEHADELLNYVQDGDTSEMTSESKVWVQPAFCLTCGKGYGAVKNLNRHIRKEHPDEIIKNEQDSDETIRVKCEICDKTYKGNTQMRFHMRRDHKTEPSNSAVPTLRCPEQCDAKFRHCKDLDHHLAVDHGLSMESTTMEIDSMEEFESWKLEIESTTLSSFVKHSSKGDKLYYYCNRSGVSHSLYAELALTPLKTGKCCPARITVKFDKKTNKFNVTHYETHVGHTQSIEYMRLSQGERIMLAEKIQSGVHFDQILEDVRGSAKSYGEMKRLHMLKKQDLRNIVREFGLDRDRAQTDDDTIYGMNTMESSDGEICSRHEDDVGIKTEYDVGVNNKIQQILNNALGLAETLSYKGLEVMRDETEKYMQKIKKIARQYPKDDAETSAEM